MILVDTGIWVSHFRKPNLQLKNLLEQQEVVLHPYVLQELLLGSFSERDLRYLLLTDLPVLQVTSDIDVTEFICNHRKSLQGIGLVDVSLLTCARLHSVKIFTLDKSLLAVCRKFNCAFEV